MLRRRRTTAVDFLIAAALGYEAFGKPMLAAGPMNQQEFPPFILLRQFAGSCNKAQLLKFFEAIIQKNKWLCFSFPFIRSVIDLFAPTLSRPSSDKHES